MAWGLEGGGVLANCRNWLVHKWNASVLPNRELFLAELTLSWKDDQASLVESNSLTVRQNWPERVIC